MGFDNVVTLSGLFYMGSKKDENCGYMETVLSWNNFWDSIQLQQPSFTPFSHNNNVFDYLEMFEINDPGIFSHCQNNTMDVKLWEKKGTSLNEVLNIPIKLHPFYDAFGNPTLINKFYKEKMPIFSFIDWINVNVGSSENAMLSAKIQIILAIGTPDQLDNLKHIRRITIPASKSPQVDRPYPVTKKTNQTALADMLSNFIDNLALSLPKRSESEQHQHCPPEPRLRRTSDLLDVLQNALKNPPQNLITSQLATPSPLKVNGKALNTPSLIGHRNSVNTNLRVLINIDSARNIMQTNKQTPSGYLSRDATRKDDKPCTYVSFEATNCDNRDQLLNYLTNIAQNSCNPYWNKQFDVMLSTELFQQSNKDFILKVWKKMSTKYSSHDPNQIEDEIIGCCAIDLTALSSGMKISGYHNIIDNKGHVNGQLKINIVPMNDIECQENNRFLTDDDTLPNSFKELENGAFDVDNIMLSRTLKRKFTELEEISQRLKSRLLDVTADDNFDVDDEFENDLNTCPEDEDENDSSHNFDWNRFSALEIECNATDEVNVNGHLHDDNELVVDRVDLLTNALQHSLLNISNTDCKDSLSTDEDISTKSKTHD